MLLLLYCLALFFLTINQSSSQAPSHVPPVSIPISISGNFAEIRPDHFHSGVDIRTQGTIGHKVYSVDEGYVSRIKVQANGYGNAVYINHPNGLTSVYGHLDSYCQKIDNYVKEIQYKNKSFEVDLFPDKSTFPISRGEFIGFSGNSGSSSGPHLHFELRKSQNQFPVNPLKYGLKLNDKTPPNISSLFVYPAAGRFLSATIQPTEYKVIKDKGIYKLTAEEPLKIAGQGSFGIEVQDRIDGSSNHCGIYILELSVGGDVVCLFKADEFSFDESRYVNALCDYNIEIQNKRKIHLLYRKPNNRLSMYPVMINNGIIDFQAGTNYPVKIRALDAHGNESILEFEVEGISRSNISETISSETQNIFRWNENNYFENSNIRLEIPRESLYEDLIFEYARTESSKSIYPYIHFIGTPTVPIHYSSRLSFLVPDIPDSLRSKTVAIKLTDKNKETGLKGIWNEDWFIIKISDFGKYTIDLDTLAPKIIPINIKSGSDMSSQTSVRFKATDNLTGIARYEGYIDNEWVLFEYDLKNDLFIYKFDKSRLKSGINHDLKFYVWDGVGNRATIKMNFFW